MVIRPIQTEADYRAALKEVEQIGEPEPGTEAFDRQDTLVTLIEAYEAYIIGLMQSEHEVLGEVDNSLEQSLMPLSKEDYNVLSESLADADAGRTLDGDTLFLRMRERSEARKTGMSR